ncbi:HD domain-containing protein [Acidovorax sp. sif1233]|uniref:HD-GYP domain-containing protein n=1 Tax=unclassified Acidovorax TaxID=2684926 RepID=UPI001C43E12F|nr:MULTISPECIES: HD domain-containing phosphohydrolase [unclassified Acidovorax]MBV7426884.1 HD domain-containing protein [Acidovorax sp. sif0732]MBV7448009.1 HD domain-containing protein [Acidovorax sp. sif0715]MBV7455046.1 HD domain-containing protein [Acidovorax sp. sif1233]
MTDSLVPAGIDTADSPHYLRALTDMADRRMVVADAAIYTDNGIKLVEKGARIDGRLYDRLVQHKLREPIDRHLSIDNPVDVPALLAAGQALVEREVLPRLLAETLGSAARLLAPLRSLPLPPSMACKLTVMREQRPELFQHSLQMMTVAVFLAIKSELGERDCANLAAAALLHDLGVLHMDPAWSDPDHKVVGVQRKHLVAHPITAMLMIRDTQAYPRPVEVAVLEHHERMDGSGYPRGLAGADISVLGRILLLAEVVAAFYEKYDDMPAQRLSLVLRLNHRKFPSALVAHLLPLLQEEVARDSALMPLGNDAPRQMDLLAEAFACWDQLKAALPPGTSAKTLPGSALAFVDARLLALQKALTEAGSHPQQQGEFMAQLRGDTMGMAEVALVGREALWQLQSILNASHRRWPQLAQRATPADGAVADWCDWALRKL